MAGVEAVDVVVDTDVVGNGSSSPGVFRSRLVSDDGSHWSNGSGVAPARFCSRQYVAYSFCATDLL